jgi:hypothetical protein
MDWSKTGSEPWPSIKQRNGRNAVSLFYFMSFYKPNP